MEFQFPCLLWHLSVHTLRRPQSCYGEALFDQSNVFSTVDNNRYNRLCYRRCYLLLPVAANVVASANGFSNESQRITYRKGVIIAVS